MRALGVEVLACLSGAVASLVALWTGYYLWLGRPAGFWPGLAGELDAGRWDGALVTALLLTAAGMVLARRPGILRGMAGSAGWSLALAARVWAPKPGGWRGLWQAAQTDWQGLVVLVVPLVVGGGVAGAVRRWAGLDGARLEIRERTGR
ncbi:MAG: hypothetical protein AB1445_00450 [Bacillota bacterium]